MRIFVYFTLFILCAFQSLIFANSFKSTFLIDQQKVEIVTDTVENIEFTLSELLQKSTLDVSYLNKIESRLIDPEELSKLIKGVKDLEKSVEDFTLDPRNENLNSLSFRNLQNLNSLWGFRKSNVEDHMDLLSEIIDQLSSEKSRIDELLIFWKEYLLENAKKNINKTLKNKISQINRKAKRVHPIFDKQLNDLLMQLDKLGYLNIGIDDKIKTINFVLQDATTSFFKTDIKPIWTHYKEFNTESFGNNLFLYFSNYKSDQKGILWNHKFSHAIMLLIFLFILGIIKIINKHPKVINKDIYPFLQNINIVFEKKITVALFLSLFLSVLVYKNIPTIFMQSIIYIEIILIIILLRIFISKIILKHILILFSLYFILKLGEIFSHQDFIGHMLLLLANSLFLIWLFRTKIKEYLLSGLFFSKTRIKIAIFYVNISFIAIAFSTIMNIIGYINVSNFITTTVLSFSIFIVIIYFWHALINNMFYSYLKIEKSDTFKLIYRERKIIYRYLSGLIRLFSLGMIAYILMTTLAVKVIFIDGFWNIMESPIVIGSFSFTLYNFALFFLIIWLSIIISRFVRIILRDEILVRAKFDRGLPATISMLARYSIITFGFFIAISAMGFEFSQLTIIFGALSVGIGFGLQNIFNNLVSGLILIFERPIHIDDTIEVNNMIGQVRSIGIRTSSIRTFDGAEVIIPNGLLISNEVINWTLSDKRRRIEVKVGVAYGSDVKKVTRLFYQVIKDHEEAIDIPPPMIIFDEFADSSLNFRILFWTDNYSDWLRIRSEILFAVNDILEKENIVIPFPQRDVHVIPPS